VEEHSAAAVGGDRLTAALLGYFVFVISVITLSPFDFTPPRQLQLSYEVVAKDVLPNTAMFVPVGFFLRGLSRVRGRGRWQSNAAAAMFSLLLELAQIFIRDRYPSPVDVVTNTCGAYLGAIVRDWLERRTAWQPGLIDRLGLHIPLVGLVYLLVPQLWLSSVGIVRARPRGVLTLLLACAGGILVVALRRHRWKRELPFGGAVMLVLALSLITVGAFPRLIYSAVLLASIAAAIVVLTWWLMRRPSSEEERRFERATLRRFLPVFSTYLLFATLWPPARAVVPWHGALTFIDRMNDAQTVDVLLLLEQVCGFTLLGYAAAEWRGRSGRSLAADLPRQMLLTGLFAVALELVQGRLAGPGASLIRALLATSGAAYGTAVYHLARDHVRALRAERDGLYWPTQG
jgi:VanZ family protein